MFTKGAKHGFVTIILNWNNSPQSGNTLSGKEKILDTAAFWDMKRPSAIDYLKKAQL